MPVAAPSNTSGARLVLQRFEAERAELGVGVTLVLLQAALVGAVDFAVGDDQVGLLGTTDQLHPQRVHRRLQRRILQAGGAGDHLELVLPERPRRRVDAADEAECRRG